MWQGDGTFYAENNGFGIEVSKGIKVALSVIVHCMRRDGGELGVSIELEVES